MKKKALISAILTLAVCLCLIAGSTYALFTTSDEVNIAVTAGKVKLTANLDEDSLLTWSLYQTEADARTDGKFENGGTAEITTEATVELKLMTPGDVAKFKIDVENKSNVNVQYRVRMICEAVDGKTDLTPALVTTAYIDGNLYPVTGSENATIWRFIDANKPIEDIWVTVSFPNHDQDGSYDNQFQEAEASVTIVVEAVQGNAYQYDVTNAESELFVGEGYFPNGILNGEGKTIAVEKEILGLAGNVTLANVTLDGTNQNTMDSTIWDTNDGEDATLILADGATIIAKEDIVAIRSSASYTGNESFTLMMDENAKIVASGSEGAAVVVQGWADNTANIVLNGSAAQCFDLTDGAIGFLFIGNDHEIMLVNMFVKTEADMADYQALVLGRSVVVNWYVDGTYVGMTQY